MPRPIRFTYDIRVWESPTDQIVLEYVRAFSTAVAHAAIASDEYGGRVVAIDCWDGDDRVGVYALFYKGTRIYHVDEFHE